MSPVAALELDDVLHHAWADRTLDILWDVPDHVGDVKVVAPGQHEDSVMLLLDRSIECLATGASLLKKQG